MINERWQVTVRSRPLFLSAWLSKEECVDLTGEWAARQSEAHPAAISIPFFGSVIFKPGRNAQIVWLESSANWLSERVNSIAPTILSSSDLRAGDLQIARYVSGGGHFWHQDTSFGVTRGPVFSVICQLSDERDYEGGDLVFLDGLSVVRAPRGQGSVCVVPSAAWHRVHPIRSGVRFSATFWLWTSESSAIG